MSMAVRDEGLHPEELAFLEFVEAQGLPPFLEMDAPDARVLRNAGMMRVPWEPAVLPRIENLSISGPAGEIPVRLYASELGGVRPGLVFLHGGGFVFGNLDTHDALCRLLAHTCGVNVVSVDYRLAPEHKFPASLEDAYAATVWVAENAERLGIDRERLSVGGDSAGGNLAAVVAVRCRDRGGPSLASQLLLYPVTDLSSLETPSYREFSEGYGLTRAAMDWFKGHYLVRPEDGAEPEASPLRTVDLVNLPPALILTAEFDPLRDEGEAYAARLKQAGVLVRMSRYAGTIHGFVSLQAVLSNGRRAIVEIHDFLKRTVAPQAAQ